MLYLNLAFKDSFTLLNAEFRGSVSPTGASRRGAKPTATQQNELSSSPTSRRYQDMGWRTVRRPTRKRLFNTYST
ncbi:hypothetical protein TNCV_4066181 [Trichonephila clavipes]|uniref:Uncharacterized protein n=1 Tax=Trichonephila clavipes TaxID=2585209 RepID=A0A8X6W8K8_TRICX|nr:hypothetical protein TNCV_4066181 [Trichonephila clavipes]